MISDHCENGPWSQFWAPQTAERSKLTTQKWLIWVWSLLLFTLRSAQIYTKVLRCSQLGIWAVKRSDSSTLLINKIISRMLLNNWSAFSYIDSYAHLYVYMNWVYCSSASQSLFYDIQNSRPTNRWPLIEQMKTSHQSQQKSSWDLSLTQCVSTETMWEQSWDDLDAKLEGLALPERWNPESMPSLYSL